MWRNGSSPPCTRPAPPSDQDQLSMEHGVWVNLAGVLACPDLSCRSLDLGLPDVRALLAKCENACG